MRFIYSLTAIISVSLIVSCGSDRRENLTTLKDGNIVLSDQSMEILDGLMDEFKDCKTGESDDECRDFISYALCEFYGIDDFEKGDGHIPYDEIASHVEGSLKWKLVGMANDQAALDKAQEAANSSHPVIAFERGKKYGHVAIILPGHLTKSGNWGLEVPNSAGFFRGKSKGYVDKKLSYSFRSGENVVMFMRD